MAQRMNRDSSELLIRHESLDLALYLSASELLILHEETIPDRVGKLKESFLRHRLVRDPVIVDAASCIVLDGMHRVAALRELDCVRVPVCAVDYSSPSIRVGVWYRTLLGRSIPDQFEKVLSPSGVRFGRISVDMTKLLEDPPLALLFSTGECFRLESDSMNAYEVLKKAERCARDLGLAVAFETEHHALEQLASKQKNAVIILPKIDKMSVRNAGLTGRPLPPKFTRHVIPARPLGVNVPIGVLTDVGTALQDANSSFVESLRTRGMTRKPPGSVIGGRRYEEETFIFN